MPITRAEKIAVTKEINELVLYIHDVYNALINQKPQPNGKVYLHGEPVTKKTLKDATRELSFLRTKREIMKLNDEQLYNRWQALDKDKFDYKNKP